MTDQEEPWHGTSGGYANHHCRCDRCKRAWSDYCADYFEALAENVPERVHGTYNGYRNYKCRCRPCKDANAAYARRYKAQDSPRKIGNARPWPEERTKRLIELSKDDTLSVRDIARELGVTKGAVVYRLNKIARESARRTLFQD